MTISNQPHTWPLCDRPLTPSERRYAYRIEKKTKPPGPTSDWPFPQPQKHERTREAA